MDEICLDLTYTEVMKLIYAFKRHPILWNFESSKHKARSDKDDAWILVATQTGMRKEVCMKKMKSLLTAVRREKARILKSKAEGRTEQPKWRYWNDFKFLRGIKDDQEDPLGTAPEMDLLDPKTAPEWLKIALAKRKYSKQSTSMAENQANEINKPISETEYTFGSMTAAKLQKMFSDQRLYAENLINQVIYKGLMGHLTKHCEVETPDLQGLTNITRESQPPNCDNTPSTSSLLECENNF